MDGPLTFDFILQIHEYECDTKPSETIFSNICCLVFSNIGSRKQEEIRNLAASNCFFYFAFKESVRERYGDPIFCVGVFLRGKG